MDTVATPPRELLAARYRIGPLLGQGGMAQVYAAEDTKLDRQVAIKMLRPQFSSDATVRYRFEQEARTAAKLSHPNVVGILDIGEDAGVAFIIMERLPGSTLADELKEGPLTEARVREIGRQVLSALGAAHAAGIVHRDIKPANILSCSGGRLKVADFGIATAMDDAQAITGTGLLIGTPAYLAPERLAGEPATASADLYSLASVLYECLTGCRPFQAMSTVELLAALRDSEPEPIVHLRSGVDEGLAQVIEQSLAKDPAARPRSAAEMARLLEEQGAPVTVETELQLATTKLAPAAAETIVLTAPGSTAVLPRDDAASPRSWEAWSGEVRHHLTEVIRPLRSAATRAVKAHRIPVVFAVAFLLALAIALPLAASGSSPPSHPAAPPAAHSTAGTSRFARPAGVPIPLGRTLQTLEKAVG